MGGISMFCKQRIINLKKNTMLTNAKIAEKIYQEDQIKVSRKTVSAFYKRYLLQGMNNKISPGRTRILSKEDLERINKSIEENPEITLRQIKNKLNLDVSFKTILSAIRRMEWVKTGTQYCQIVSKENRAKRLAYCLMVDYFDEQFDDCIFLDESIIEIAIYSGFRYYKKGEKVKKVPKPKKPLKLHVYAGISKKGATDIYIYKGNSNSKNFQHMLNTIIVPFVRKHYPDSHRLVMDNDPKHMSLDTQRWLKENNINHWNHPAQSPDLNPIENVWHHLKWYIRSAVKPSTENDLVGGIKDFWKTYVTPEFCQKYISHLRKVVPTVIARHGKATEY